MGWGSHHLILGGAVKRPAHLRRLPHSRGERPDDTSTGRWIPTTAIDHTSANFWPPGLGWINSNLPTVFPNIGRFSTPTGFCLDRRQTVLANGHSSAGLWFDPFHKTFHRLWDGLPQLFARIRLLLGPVFHRRTRHISCSFSHESHGRRVLFRNWTVVMRNAVCPLWLAPRKTNWS